MGCMGRTIERARLVSILVMLTSIMALLLLLWADHERREEISRLEALLENQADSYAGLFERSGHLLRSVDTSSPVYFYDEDGEVIIRATRRAESIQDVPIRVTAISPEHLVLQGAQVIDVDQENPDEDEKPINEDNGSPDGKDPEFETSDQLGDFEGKGKITLWGGNWDGSDFESKFMIGLQVI